VTVDAHLAAAVRAALLDCGFTAEGVLARIGADALAAIGLDLTEPAKRAVDRAGRGAADAPLDALIRLFLLGESFPPNNCLRRWGRVCSPLA
jgi:hypothetical protein